MSERLGTPLLYSRTILIPVFSRYNSFFIPSSLPGADLLIDYNGTHNQFRITANRSNSGPVMEFLRLRAIKGGALRDCLSRGFV